MEVEADAGEDGVYAVAMVAVEVISVHSVIMFGVADSWFNDGAATEFLFDFAEDAALLTAFEHSVWVVIIMTGISFIDVIMRRLSADNFGDVFDGLF